MTTNPSDKTCLRSGSPCSCTLGISNRCKGEPAVYLTSKATDRKLAGLGHNGGPPLDPLPAKSSGGSLPDAADKRNEYPMAEGLLDYFPNALAEVSRLSFLATQQHHPDQPMHWDRGKSTDHANKIMRHLIDIGKFDDKGLRHSTMVAWRALANLQDELERSEGLPASKASRNRPY